MIEVKKLRFSYGKNEILKGVSFQIPKNRLCALLGSNGSGKSTLFNCCMNFLRPKSGEIYINGEFSLNKNPAWMAKNVSFVAQQNSGVFAFSVLEVVLMGRSPFMRGFIHKNLDIKIAKDALNLVGIYHLKDKIITNLSGGERQLVFIARAIAQNCPVIMLDEPTSALDFRNSLVFWEIITKIKNKSTILVCTHEPNHALWFCDEIVALKKGEIIASGEAKKTLNEANLAQIYDKKCQILTDYSNDKNIKFITPQF